MRPRDKTPEEIAEVGRPIVKARAPLRELRDLQEKAEDAWPAQMRAMGLVNYASAPAGGQTYDANWLATNTTAR